ncbi:uncharacterized protein MYCFIDRAFT_80034 [Pseudocercospora fijiensis CIRAD86]|uniref:Uncharacterized protein n=1 Tax=Pseudocercospora fijiensis (strain CIRAD86) TaxID=383855 RepID=M3ATL0_PSEFD|nr:uncharacterized protein MYCFIDRAFT_80034 [Pseudocercospora fijiensis CIRAD86]EME80802.1 hypothetical protein MYCFIDRAFT_80034 [Pseudocercospora fijiensis CIRAD86]
MFHALCRRHHHTHLAAVKRCLSAQVSCFSSSAVRCHASRPPSPPPPNRPQPEPAAYVKRQPQLVALQSRPELTVDEFEELANRGEGSIEQAEACLYQLKTQLSQLPLRERHEKCLQHNAGKRILLWYWKRRATHEPTPNRTFAQLLTWSPANALKCFQRALQKFGQYPSPQNPSMLLGIRVATEHAIRNTRHPPYDSTLWDSYYQNLPHGVECRRAQATALLYHPSMADGLAFYDYLQWLSRDGVPKVWSARDAAKSSFTMLVLRASYILRLQGHGEKAQWLRGQAELHNAPFCMANSEGFFKDCDLDPKLEPLRRKAGVSGLSSLTSDTYQLHLHELHTWRGKGIT